MTSFSASRSMISRNCRVWKQEYDARFFSGMEKLDCRIHASICILFLVEKSLGKKNCLLVCPHLTDWSKSIKEIYWEIFFIKLEQRVIEGGQFESNVSFN